MFINQGQHLTVQWHKLNWQRFQFLNLHRPLVIHERDFAKDPSQELPHTAYESKHFEAPSVLSTESRES